MIAHEFEHARQDSKLSDGTDKSKPELEGEHRDIYDRQIHLRQDIREFLESLELLDDGGRNKLETFGAAVRHHRDNIGNGH